MVPFLLDLTPWQLTGCILLIVACVALILFLLFRKTKSMPAAEVSVPEGLIGQTGTVTETVDSDAGTGLVDIGGEGWAARSVYTDDVYEVGTAVTVVAIEGVKVIVKQA